MEHFGGQLTTSASGRTVVPSQDGVFMKALDSIWEIPAQNVASSKSSSSNWEIPDKEREAPYVRRKQGTCSSHL